MFFSWLKNAFVGAFQKDVRAGLLFFFISYLSGTIVFALVKCVVRLLKKRRHNFEWERQVEFALPDRENTYVRSRLATVLNTESTEEQEREETLPITFTHAQSLLRSLWFAPLSQAERLEMQTLEDDLKKYGERTHFSSKDVRKLNDLFARLLKLSAKHGV